MSFAFVSNEIETIENESEETTIPGIDPITKKFLPGNKLGTGPKQYKESTIAIRNLRNQVLNQISPEIIPIWLKLLHSNSEKIQAAALKLAVETVFPKQILHNLVGKVLHEMDGDGEGKTQGLINALPQFGEFLKWKADQDRKAQAIDITPPGDGDNGK